jgi:Tol biopolymer transport system component
VQLAWLDRKGGQVGTVGAPGPYGQIALSPDKRNLAFEMADGVKGQSDLWVMDVARGVPSRVTATPGNEYDPVWAPDGRSLVFGAEGDGTAAVWRKGLRASEPETVLVDTPDQDFPEFWSGDGATLLFLRLNTGATENVKSAWAFPLGGGDPSEVLRTAASRIDEPQLSPDGRWLAYMSDESGRYEVYAEPFRRDGDRVRVSVDGGGQPRWRGDGRELFYATPTGRLMAVAVRAPGDRLEVSLPVELFEIPGMRPSGEFDDYAASRDGQRFLVKLPVEQASTLKLHVVTNWTSLLSTGKAPAP